VDIKQEAIEIGRLRLWLSLVVDAQEPEPLPNLDYKLMAGDGVLETMDGTRFGDTGALLGEDAKINDLIKRIEVTRDAFFSEESPLERKKKRDVLMQLERELFGFDVDWRVKNLDEEITILRRRAHNKKGDSAKDLEMTLRLNALMDLKNKVLQDLEPLPFFLHRVHFSEVMQRQNAGFDIVLGNPPYVRIEKLEKSVKEALKNAFADVHSGTADLYVYFYRKGIELLRQNGRLAFITPNKFLRAGYGQAIRDFLAQQTTLEMLIDFGDLPVFDATTYPFITVARKAIPSKDHSLEMIPEKTLKNRIGDARENGVVGVREALNAFHDYARELILPLQQQTLRKEGWVLGDPNVLALLEKLRGTGVSLNEFVDGKFYRGVVTGLNEAFVIDRATRDTLIAEDPKSAELIKPFLRGRDIKRWRVKFAEKYLIFTRQGSVKLEEYPAIKKHLEKFKTKLEPKPLDWSGKWEGRKSGPYKWFEIQDQVAYYEEFEKPKILYPDISQRMPFALDTSGSFGVNTMYFTPLKQNWILPVLNSDLLEWIYAQISSSIMGGFLRFFTDYVSQLPIVQPNPQQQTILESITDDSRITELNAVVYQMYGLTLEEIALVETHTAGVVVGAETDLDVE
jgi:adenine-specific DNA-methyltransferase